MWIGARLEQGVWYPMTAPLSLPGMPQFVIQQRIEFAFTRMTPCTRGAAAQKCVEIVLHAIPDEKALTDVLADLREDGTYFVDYDAAREERIVVDPETLLPSTHEEQVYWYASIGKGDGDALLESEHLVTTATYGAQ
jgi:hypothetical protein